MIGELFVLALNRKPTPEELSSMQALLATAENDHSVYEDILWGLLNSTEFAFNH